LKRRILMEKTMVILADAEREYVAALAGQLAARLPGHLVYGCCRLADWPEPGQLAKYGKCLCLFNPLDFPDLPRLCANEKGAFNCTFWSVQPGRRPDEPAQNASGSASPLIRLDSAGVFAARISDWLASDAGVFGQDLDLQPEAGLKQINIERPIAMPAEDKCSAAEAGIRLLFCLESSGYRPDLSRLRLLELVRTGRKVVYLPIMPTYQMTCLSAPGQGPSMSDLLLRVLSRSIEPPEVGQYLQPHPDGYLQFRPPDRSDDLVVCSPDLLRNLVNLIRRWIMACPCTVLIDCAGIPLASLSCIAVLCDSCEFCLPERECFAASSARREISYILALLPSGCAVSENGTGRPPAPRCDRDFD
jgi:hypothetical protein